MNCRKITGLGKGYDVALFVTLWRDLQNKMSGKWEELSSVGERYNTAET